MILRTLFYCFAIIALTACSLASSPQQPDYQQEALLNQASSYFNQGEAYRRQGFYQAAVKQYQAALPLFIAHQQLKMQATTLMKLGWLELQQGNLTSAKQYHATLQQLIEFEALDNFVSLALSAKIAETEGHIEKAKTLYQQIIESRQPNSESYWYFKTALLGLNINAASAAQLDQIIQELNSKMQQGKLNNIEVLIHALQLYVDWAVTQPQKSNTENYLQWLLAIYGQQEMLGAQLNHYQLMSDYYQQQGEFTKAEYYKAHKQSLQALIKSLKPEN